MKNKKKAIKLVTASAVAASAFVAAAPASQAAATSATTVVNNNVKAVESAFKKLLSLYNGPFAAEQTITKITTQYANTKLVYDKAVKAVNAAKVDAKTKSKALASMQASYKKYFVPRASTYTSAANYYAQLMPALDKVTMAVEAGNKEAAKMALPALEAQLDAGHFKVYNTVAESSIRSYFLSAYDAAKVVCEDAKAFADSTETGDGAVSAIAAAVEVGTKNVTVSSTVTGVKEATVTLYKDGETTATATKVVEIKDGKAATTFTDVAPGKYTVKVTAGTDSKTSDVVEVKGLVAGVESVMATNATTVEVKFKEAVNNVNALNFTIDGLDVKNAAIKQTDGKTVVLTTATQEGGKDYTVMLDGNTAGKFAGVSAVVPTSIKLVNKTAQAQVGQQVTLKADIGTKVAGVPVTFNVQAEVGTLNQNQVKEVLTDADGIATYTYTQYSAYKDQVAVYPTGAPAVRDFMSVYWGVQPVLSVEEVVTNTTTVSNGASKTYKVTYRNAITGQAVNNASLRVLFKENMATINGSTATATNVSGGATSGLAVFPYQNDTNEKTLEIVTNSLGQATFTVTGSNTVATPIVFQDINTNSRLDGTELQAEGPKVTFTGAQASNQITVTPSTDAQVAASSNRGRVYTVEVKNASGTPYSGGKVVLGFKENESGQLNQSTNAQIVWTDSRPTASLRTSPTTGIDKGVIAASNPTKISLNLNADGKATFMIANTTTGQVATPVIWIDQNSNPNNILDSGEPFAYGATSIFVERNVTSGLLEAGSTVAAANKEIVYTYTLRDQNNAAFNNSEAARITYTFHASGAPVEISTPDGFDPNTFSVNGAVNTTWTAATNGGIFTLQAGQSVTIAGTTPVNETSGKFTVRSTKDGSVSVTASALTLTKNTYLPETTDTTKWGIDAGSIIPRFATGSNEVQKLDGMASAPYTLSFGGKTTVSPLAANATVTEVQTALEGLSTIGKDNVTVTGTGVIAGTAAVLTLKTSTDADGGTYTLNIDGRTTAPIAYNANTAAIQTALDNALGLNVVTVTGTSSPYTITFATPKTVTVGNVDSSKLNIAPLSPVTATAPAAAAQKAAGVAVKGEVQVFKATTALSTGDFVINIDGTKTAPIAFDATGVDTAVTTALTNAFGSGNVTVVAPDALTTVGKTLTVSVLGGSFFGKPVSITVEPATHGLTGVIAAEAAGSSHGVTPIAAVQTFKTSVDANGGTFDLKVTDSDSSPTVQTASALPYNATAAQMTSAVNTALATKGTVTITNTDGKDGQAGAAYAITYDASYVGAPTLAVLVGTSLTKGTPRTPSPVVVDTTTPGVAPTQAGALPYTITFKGELAGRNVPNVTTSASGLTVSELNPGTRGMSSNQDTAFSVAGVVVSYDSYQGFGNLTIKNSANELLTFNYDRSDSLQLGSGSITVGSFENILSDNDVVTVQIAPHATTSTINIVTNN